MPQLTKLSNVVILFQKIGFFIVFSTVHSLNLMSQHKYQQTKAYAFLHHQLLPLDKKESRQKRKKT